MRAVAFIFFLFLYSVSLNAQINVPKFDLSIESEFRDTIQRIYENFLNTEVERISLVAIERSYDEGSYYHFLKNKKFFESKRKWIKNNSYQESIIILGNLYPLTHFDSMVFDAEYAGVKEKFLGKEVFLDSTETKTALQIIFEGYKYSEDEIITFCYTPRHAILFYDENNQITGIFEICFECGNVLIGIVGVSDPLKANLHQLKPFFEKHKFPIYPKKRNKKHN